MKERNSLETFILLSRKRQIDCNPVLPMQSNLDNESDSLCGCGKH